MLTVLADAMMYATRTKRDGTPWDAPGHWHADHPRNAENRRRAEERAWLTRTGLK